ncbi:MAG: polysaccharide biosynthesis protein [Nitrospirae bacterium]|nr:polysaccharide biosynthesis protein [Nitrospirota bacterium]MBI5696173.1 polysaccharide biosynthesis protein [Nitrospirota bacterium]
MSKDKKAYAGKKVLVTGGVGTVGTELVRQLVGIGAGEVRVFDNNEAEIFFMLERYRDNPAVKCFLGDVRDKDKLAKVMTGADVVFHAAAYKHVVVCETNPFDAVQTNIVGTQNVIECALNLDVERVIFTSSDKAVNPTNVMGTSKLMGERLITSANNYRWHKRVIFSSTRFGNVVGSRGSVIPVFGEQIKKGGPVTLTDERMTRFVMTVEESARLVLEAGRLARGGEVFITKMPVLKIAELAKAMIEILAPRFGHDPAKMKTVTIGAKPGEKMYEELMSDEETARSIEIRDLFVTLPAFRNIYKEIEYKYPGQKTSPVTKPYISSLEETMSVAEIKTFLLDNGILEDYL